MLAMPGRVGLGSPASTFLANEVMARINAHLGTQVVSALRFVQTFGDAPQPPIVPPPADPAKLAEVEASLAHMPDGELRAALTALGQAVVSQVGPSTARLPKL